MQEIIQLDKRRSYVIDTNELQWSGSNLLAEHSEVGKKLSEVMHRIENANGLDKSKVELRGARSQRFKDIASKILEVDENRYIFFKEVLSTREQKEATRGNCIIGGITAALAGGAAYWGGSYVATELADVLNHATYFLAPIAGILQTGISLGGLALGALIGVSPGTAIGDRLFAQPYYRRRAEDYRALINHMEIRH